MILALYPSDLVGGLIYHTRHPVHVLVYQNPNAVDSVLRYPSTALACNDI